MEASERPQLPLDHGDAGTVRALADRLVIESLTVADERAARVVRERAEGGHAPAQTVRDAIEIGTRVLEREGTAVEVDYVRAEFERHAAELRERIAKALESGDELLAERITETFDGSRDGSVQKDIDTLMRQALVEQREALMKQFSAQEGSNPLFDFKDAMVRVYKELGTSQRAEGEENRKVIAELKRELVELKERTGADSRVAEEAERGTAKGRSFEELVHATIEEIAQAQGDAAHHVGDSSTESGGKKGDTVVEIGAALGTPLATVVFEAKNKRLSKNDAWTELNGCMGERDAAFAVLVVAGDDKVPSGLEELTEYQGNKMIAVLDRETPDPLALRLVYRYVRARVLAEGAAELEVDAAGVRDAAEEAAARLKRANRVRKSLTNVTNSAKAAGDEFDEMVADVERCLARIEGLVAAAAEDAA
ncbi:MAG: hypothetical protein QOI10_1688 [Solirubrobacterales bacterium]|nr:hypothetical protein [Solirubrobacterales bacterium]